MALIMSICVQNANPTVNNPNETMWKENTSNV